MRRLEDRTASIFAAWRQSTLCPVDRQSRLCLAADTLAEGMPAAFRRKRKAALIFIGFRVEIRIGPHISHMSTLYSAVDAARLPQATR
jgi:hypothetical protein